MPAIEYSKFMVRSSQSFAHVGVADRHSEKRQGEGDHEKVEHVSSLCADVAGIQSVSFTDEVPSDA